MREAVRAYRFRLLSELTPLLKELSSVVVQYLVWYRDPQSFHVGDRVDVKDVKGRWCAAVVRTVAEDEVRVGYEGASKKWDQWLDVHSDRLAPFGSETRGQYTGRERAEQRAPDEPRAGEEPHPPLRTEAGSS